LKVNMPAESIGLRRKQTAVEFLEMVGAGKIDDAYREYAEPIGKHHNPFFAAGFTALREAMKENALQFPAMRLTVKNVIGDGDLVAIHSHVVLRPGEPGLATMHLFRFMGNKIVEIWDIGQPVPADSTNQDGMF
jgi:predicted SnoaL-like aldol condensation-catalyzing enzyme